MTTQRRLGPRQPKRLRDQPLDVRVTVALAQQIMLQTRLQPNVVIISHRECRHRNVPRTPRATGRSDRLKETHRGAALHLPVPSLRRGRPREAKFPANRVDVGCQKQSGPVVFWPNHPADPVRFSEATTDRCPATRRCVWAPIPTGSSTAPRDNCAGCLSGHVRADNRRWTREDANNKGAVATPQSTINLT
jgi:hypothetical protein